MNSAPGVVRLAAAQIDAAADMLARAFFENPMPTYLAGDRDLRARVLPLLFASYTRYGHLFGEVYTTQRRVDGIAIWLPPGERPPMVSVSEQIGLQKVVETLGTEAWERYRRVGDNVGRSPLRRLPARHWYLMLLGVDPSHRRQGVARALLEPNFARADLDRLPCYLDTPEPKNVPFYRGRGFEIVAEIDEPSSGLTFWTFRREPRGLVASQDISGQAAVRGARLPSRAW